MESLTLDRAMELYEVLGSHIPSVKDEETDVFEFIGKIIEDINSSGNHRAYTISMEIMSGKNLQELQEMSSEERLELFTEGLIQNKILKLVTFCNSIGF